MRILLACEESQAVCKEFRELGHEAFSCDIIDCSGSNRDWHIKDDVLNVIHNYKWKWDMMIAFPPCTHLAVSGARHFQQKRKDGRQQKGIEFFMQMLNAPIPLIAVENPIGIISGDYIGREIPELKEKYNLPIKPSQIIHPYHFGDPYSKATCLWLKGLKPLTYNKKKDKQKELVFEEYPTEVDKGEFVTFSSGKRMAKWYNEASGNGHLRSKTFPGIAKAMAEQWGK